MANTCRGLDSIIACRERNGRSALPSKTHSYQTFAEQVNQYAGSEGVKKLISYWQKTLQNIQLSVSSFLK
ncbi:hypothetical protein ACEQPO_04690 [Bacillus sp. SL00103]